MYRNKLPIQRTIQETISLTRFIIPLMSRIPPLVEPTLPWIKMDN